jgi:hypothetical protein
MGNRELVQRAGDYEIHQILNLRRTIVKSRRGR